MHTMFFFKATPWHASDSKIRSWLAVLKSCATARWSAASFSPAIRAAAWSSGTVEIMADMPLSALTAVHREFTFVDHTTQSQPRPALMLAGAFLWRHLNAY